VPYWNAESVNEFIKKWNQEKAPYFDPILDPVNMDDFAFLHSYGKFDYSKTTRCFSQDNFCNFHDVTVEDHIEKVNTIAKSEGYAIYYLEDVIMEDLPTNQVELFFTLIAQRHILPNKTSYASPSSSKYSSWK